MQEKLLSRVSTLICSATCGNLIDGIHCITKDKPVESLCWQKLHGTISRKYDCGQDENGLNCYIIINTVAIQGVHLVKIKTLENGKLSWKGSKKIGEFDQVAQKDFMNLVLKLATENFEHMWNNLNLVIKSVKDLFEWKPVHKIEDLKKFDVLMAKRTCFYHHSGLYVENGEVFHITADETKYLGAKLATTSYEEFKGKSQVKVGRLRYKVFSDDVMEQRMKSIKEGQFDYDIFYNNCQHLTNYIVLDIQVSEEAQCARRVLRELTNGKIVCAISFISRIVTQIRKPQNQSLETSIEGKLNSGPNLEKYEKLPDLETTRQLEKI